MRFEGKLDQWNDDRGFGFITPSRGGEPVFVHISVFARDGRRPQVGAALSFEVEPAGDGKKRAIKVEYAGSASRPVAPMEPLDDSTRPRQPRRGRSVWPFMGVAAALLVVAIGGGHLYGRTEPGAAVPARPEATPAAPPPVENRFRCDGRIHCSQMTSCEEAEFFLKNCPGTQMDGDRDGVPCESQWCPDGWRR